MRVRQAREASAAPAAKRAKVKKGQAAPGGVRNNPAALPSTIPPAPGKVVHTGGLGGACPARSGVVTCRISPACTSHGSWMARPQLCAGFSSASGRSITPSTATIPSLAPSPGSFLARGRCRLRRPRLSCAHLSLTQHQHGIAVAVSLDFCRPYPLAAAASPTLSCMRLADSSEPSRPGQGPIRSPRSWQLVCPLASTS